MLKLGLLIFHKLYTANVLDAKIATKSSVTFPAALRMPFLQLIVAANY